MNYNLADKTELKAARNRMSYLARKDSVIKLTKVNPKRSLSQNNYLHLILSAFGAHFGYTLEESKLIYKEVNKSFYEYQKKGRVFSRSSADLDKEEMSYTIDRFMEKSAEAGCELPLATDQDWLMQIENEIERNKRYL